MTSHLKRYLPLIEQLPDANDLDKSDLMNSRFLMEKQGNIELYYAPHNEYINDHAKIVIVGITPGWTQMKAAYQEAKKCLQEGMPIDQMMKRTKNAARFVGTMRKNLIEMLDDCGVNTALNLTSCGLLFNEDHNLLHTTSVIKYPVFVNGKNYTGYTPKIDQSSLLSKYAYQAFPEEINEMKNDYLLVPLGNAVTEVIVDVVNQGKISRNQCLFGFPHPSGANGHRKQQFEREKSRLQLLVRNFARFLPYGHKLH